MIKTDIAPLLVDCNPGVKDHYIKMIKKRTQAASIKSVSLLIDEAIQEMNDDVSCSDSDAVIETTIDPDIIEMAEQISLRPHVVQEKNRYRQSTGCHQRTEKIPGCISW